MAAREYKPLDADAIEKNLASRRIGKKILIFRETASANDIAWEYSGNPENDGLCVFAEHQTAGRGRHGNRWLAPPGQGLLASILLMDWTAGADLLTLAAAAATAETIQRRVDAEVRIKWPNDILAGYRKIAGILVESKIGKAAPIYVVGIGINCHQESEFFDRAELAMPATSVDLHRSDPVDRNDLARNLIEQMEDRLAVARQDERVIVEQCMAINSQLGRHLVVEYRRHRFSGTCIGIDPIQGLIMQLDRGGVSMFPACQSRIVKEIHKPDSEPNP
ncbi:MAG: biotin--[acetyl-CoA-carboxylase] ligase [Sedimentisphaerales bacterium]|nr:biotin--[acetyl-CoA-carboxylase] ligase [Sedimentisphaerales bacterium]